MTLAHRPEIDGLRAVAVVPVILFHAGFKAFGGGYVGVDVFFVISGYLITSILLAELATGRFSLAHFYERRARRILPALFTVMLASAVLGWFFLLPDDMKHFGRSMAAVSVFLSNILFWRESGYFDQAADLKPLLHTWSLAVEEQYYVAFPLLLMLLSKTGMRSTQAVLVLLGIASLAYAQWASFARPSAAFYLLPARGWELLVGASTALYLARRPAPAGAALREAGGWLGLALIAFAVLAYDQATPFPGIYALAPAVGTALVVLFATRQSSAGKVLGHKALVGIGLVSYSAYLWHQPLFAFARHGYKGEPPAAAFSALSVLALVLGALSWRFVERPFRNRSRFTSRQILVASVLGTAFCFGLGMFISAKKGFESRLDAQQRELLAFTAYDYKAVYRQGDCFLNFEQSADAFKPRCSADDPAGPILVWGDSHAAAMSHGVRRTFPATSQFTAGGCPPLLGFTDPKAIHCPGVNAFVLRQIAASKPRIVLLHANWVLYKDRDVPAMLEPTVEAVQSASPASRIVVVGNVPQYLPSLPAYLLSRHVVLADGVRVPAPRDEQALQSDARLQGLAQRRGVEFFSARSAFCEPGACLVTAADGPSVLPTAWDYGHLTSAGSMVLARKIQASIRRD